MYYSSPESVSTPSGDERGSISERIENINSVVSICTDVGEGEGVEVFGTSASHSTGNRGGIVISRWGAGHLEYFAFKRPRFPCSGDFTDS